MAKSFHFQRGDEHQNDNHQFGVISRLESLEEQVTLLHGFIQKLFGNNYRDYCGKSKRRDIIIQARLKSRNNLNDHNNHNQQDKTDVNRQDEDDDQNDDVVFQCTDPLINPFLETTNNEEMCNENDPISLESQSQEGNLNDNDTDETIKDRTTNQEILEPGEILPQESTSTGNNSRNDDNNMEILEVIQERQQQQQQQNRVDFFDDGVDQQQFMFEEEDAEPFDTELDDGTVEEKDVKVLTTILDMPEPCSFDKSYESMSSSSSSHNSGRETRGPRGGESFNSAASRIMKIKLEHGQSQNITSNTTRHNNNDSNSRPKRSTASFPSSSSTSTTVRKKKKKIPRVGDGEVNSDNNEDSDFQLESGEDEDAELSSSSSNSEDPDWKAKKVKVEREPFLRIKRRGRPSKIELVNTKFASTLAASQFQIQNQPRRILPKPQFLHNSTPQLIPLPFSQKILPLTNPPGGSGGIRPPPPFSKVPQIFCYKNPIEMLPKVINGVYFRLISIVPDKQHNSVVVIKAKCAICEVNQKDAKTKKPVIICGYGKSDANFVEHFKSFHPINYLHYLSNMQKIDACTTKLRQVISKHAGSQQSSEVLFISNHLKKITTL